MSFSPRVVSALRRTVTGTYVVSAFRRTVTVRLKPDTTNEKAIDL
jgi:hypothetical protein